MKFVILVFLVWRILIFIPLFCGNVFLPYREAQEFTNIKAELPPESIINSTLLYSWANFDGVNYLSIAGNGYNLDGRYFPLFPLTINLLSRLFGDTTAFGLTQFFTALIISNIIFFLALIFFYKLIRLDHSENISKLAIIILLIFPTSFFFVSIYSEGLFLLLSVLSFYCARKNKWFLASVFGGLLSAIRLVGILILPALLIEYFIQKKKASFNIIYLLLIIPVGILSFMWLNIQKWGNALYFIQNQGELANGRSTDGLIFFPQTIIRYLKIFLTVSMSQYELWIALLEFAIFLGTVCLLFKAWKLKVRLSYIFFSMLVFAIPVSSGTFTGLPRYILVMFILPIVLAILLSGKLKYIYLILSSILLFILLMLFARGYYVA